MGTGVPLLNEYKQEFFWKRFPQTLLGGPKLRLGYEAPAYVYLNQIVLYLLPLLLGIGLTVAAALTTDSVESYIYACIFGGLLFIIGLTSNILSAVSKAKKGKIAPALPGRINILAEEDEILFESCCGPETVDFVIPGKKFKLYILLHPVIVGVVGGMAFMYLVPENLDKIFGSTAATIVICALGWITITIGLFSLTGHPPPEWAQFRASDSEEHYSPIMRPFYIAAFCIVDLVNRSYPELSTWNYVLHILFVLLPLFWTFGLLPPLDALFLFLFEQAHVILFGGSPMASDIRTVIYVIVSVIIYIICFLIENTYARIAIMAAFGFLLSINLSGLMEQILNRLSKEKSPTYLLVAAECKGFLWKWRWKEVVFFVIMLCVATGTAIGVYAASEASDLSSIGRYLGLAMWAFVVLDVILCQLQGVYAVFGLFRNRLFPKSVARTAIFTTSKKKLRFVGLLRRFLIEFVAPLTLMAYLAIALGVEKMDGTSSLFWIDLMGAVRAFRWAWQGSLWCVLEVGVVALLDEALSSSASASSWSAYTPALRLLVVGFSRERLVRLAGQLRGVLAVALSSWLEPKQRRSSTVPMLVLNAVLFPVLCLLPAALASAFAAPLLPLFTLPLFIIGYPRPTRFWPSRVGASANINEDTAFYEQLTPQLCKALRHAFANGSMGEPWAGSHFMARFQDRLVWIQVLERGYGYCALSVKGLELQETSCHTVEAARVDDIVDTAFERESVPCCLLNTYPLCALQARDAALIHTYSDAKNQLTGIIDTPQVHTTISAVFQKTLTWVLLHEMRSVKERVEGKDSRSGSALTTHFQSLHKLNTIGSPEASQSPVATQQLEEKSKVKEKERRDSERSALSFGGPTADWSDDDSIFSNDAVNTTSKVNARQAESVAKHIHELNQAKPKPLNGYESDDSNSNWNNRKSKVGNDADVDDLFNELGLAAMDMSMSAKKETATKQARSPDTHLPLIHRHNDMSMTRILDAQKLTSAFSLQLAPPSKWQEVPHQALAERTPHAEFSREWLGRVVRGLAFTHDRRHSSISIAAEVAADAQLIAAYEQLVKACHVIVNVLGSSSGGLMMKHSGPMSLYKIYNGEIPWSKCADWINDDAELKALVIKAYRYAVKVAIEAAIMGEEEVSDEELQEYMEEYDSSWYIGSEKDHAWSEAVSVSKPQLFSFTHDQTAGTFHSRVLSLTETPVYLGSLCTELVHAQWANLNLELYYMTNDDEERYSIQANATLLRNLTVQAADPPLGYPIYASQPISVPTL